MHIPRELIEQFTNGNGAIFVGGDISTAAGLRDITAITNELAEELDGCPKNLPAHDIAQFYVNEYGKRRLIEKLWQHLDTTHVKPSPIHSALVQLPVKYIFTTNYDNLIELALQGVPRHYNVSVK